MSVPQPEPGRPILFGLGAFLGTFLFIPLWDIFALIYAIVIGWRARRDAKTLEQSDAGLAVLIQPVRRVFFLGLAFLIAYIGVTGLHQLVGQPGPFGYLATGVMNYKTLVTSAQCCDVSTVIAPNQPIVELMAARIPPTLRLLASVSFFTALFAAILVAAGILMHRLIARREMIGTAIYSILKLVAMRIFTPAVSGIGLTAILFLAVRFHWFPVGGISSVRGGGPEIANVQIRYLLLPGIIAALLPSLITAQAGFRAWQSWREHHGNDETSWAVLGLEMARAFYDQAGWVIGITLVVETLFAYPGMSRLMVDALIRQDPSAVVGVLSAIPFFLLVANLRTALTRSAQRAYIFAHGGENPPATTTSSAARKKATTAKSRPKQLETIWLLIALALLIFPIISVVRSYITVTQDPNQSNLAEPYVTPSTLHPMGTDALGRDVQARVLIGERVTITVALVAVLTALVFGGLWGTVSIAVQRVIAWKWTALAETAADALRLPADAAILLHPALLVLMFTIPHFSQSENGQSLAMVGWAIGLILTPRLAWAVESLWDAAPRDRDLRGKLLTILAVFCAGVLFAAYQYSLAVDFTQNGIGSLIPSLGNLLSNPQDYLVGISTTGLTDPRYYLIAYNVASTVALPALSFYVLQDALQDFFGFRHKRFLSRLFT